MKKILSFIFILICSFQAALSQETGKPTSKVIDAAKLLEDVKILSADDMQGRKVGTEGGAKAREYVLKRFRESGLQQFGSSYLQSFEFAGRGAAKINGSNVVGYIKGKKNADKYIVITGHYDHEGVVRGEIYNGADDNASGTSALFALAKYFNENKPDNSLIFVAFDAEESGLQGAKKFVEQLPVKKEQVLLNINLDMVSRNDKNELYASGTYHYPFLKPYLEEVVKSKDTKIKLILGHDQPNPPQDDWTFQSDHFPFHQAKIPFIYFGVEDHKDYHKPTDDFVNINPTFYVNAVETILMSVKILDLNLTKKE